MRLEPRTDIPPYLPVLAPLLAVVCAFVLAAVLVRLAGASVLDAAGAMIRGALGNRNALAETLTRATPLIFTGLAVTVAFRARFWNIGAEGQLYAGALAVTWIGTGGLTLPPYLMIPLLLLGGALAGGLTLLPSVLLRVFGRVDEVVTTLLLNFVILLLVSFLLEGPWRDPLSLGWPQGAPVIDAGVLPPLFPGRRLHFGFIIALGCALLLWQLLKRSLLGFRLRAVGANSRAAYTAGIPVTSTLICVALLSGGLAGLAGVSETAGLKGYLTLDLSPGFGYSGIAVAMLAALNPLGVVAAAIFLSGLTVGAGAMSRSLDVPIYLADVIEAMILLAVLVSFICVRYRFARRPRQASAPRHPSPPAHPTSAQGPF